MLQKQQECDWPQYKHLLIRKEKSLLFFGFSNQQIVFSNLVSRQYLNKKMNKSVNNEYSPSARMQCKAIKESYLENDHPEGKDIDRKGIIFVKQHLRRHVLTRAANRQFPLLVAWQQVVFQTGVGVAGGEICGVPRGSRRVVRRATLIHKPSETKVGQLAVPVFVQENVLYKVVIRKEFE